MNKHYYYIINNENELNTILNYYKNSIIIDILIEHGLGFYKKYNIDLLIKDKEPEWFIKFLNKNIDTLIIKNFDKISFNSTGFQLVKNIIENNRIEIYDNDKIVKSFNLDNNIKLILLVSNEYYQLQNFIKNKPEYSKYFIKNIQYNSVLYCK